jgi:HD-GYP domain-containing protein (c-di-GMP phosphodiesterase class II)
MRQRIRLRGVSREIEGRAWEGLELLRIGRQQPWEVELRDRSISRCHAELTCLDQHGWYARDLGSTNGTFLNGIRIGPEGRRVRERDLLQVGNLVLRVVSIDQVGVPALEANNVAVHVEATTQHSWTEAFEIVARHVAQNPRTGSQLLELLSLGQNLHHHKSIEELLHKNLEDTVRTLNARGGALLLVDETTGQLTLQASIPVAGVGEAARRYSSTLAERCLTRGESLLTCNPHQDADLRRADSIKRGKMRSVLCALLRSPTRRLGVLHLDRGPGDKPFRIEELHLADALAASMAGSIESAQFLLAKQRSWFVQTVITLAQTVEVRDAYTAGHAERVTRYALLLAKEMQLSSQSRQQIEIGSRLHDIGKIGILDTVLRKPGRLTKEEYEHMKSHTVKGAAILATIPDLAPVLPIVRNHHERWDGCGYPDRLVAENIPLPARIVAVADAFDAMTSSRTYRGSLSLDEAFGELQRGAGSQFDPKCWQAFLNLKPRLAELVRQTDSVMVMPVATGVSEVAEVA